jgi:HEAT repeat protein
MLTAAFVGCSEPAAAPPPDAPWLDPKQQIELLNQSDNRLRMLAARNLGRLGAQASEAIPHLEKMAEDPDPKVSQNAREALEKIRAASSQSAK